MPTRTVIKAIGLALLVAGIGLAAWGYQMSDSIQSQLSEAVTGSVSDPVMTRYIAGAACAVVGAFLFFRR